MEHISYSYLRVRTKLKETTNIHIMEHILWNSSSQINRNCYASFNASQLSIVKFILNNWGELCRTSCLNAYFIPNTSFRLSGSKRQISLKLLTIAEKRPRHEFKWKMSSYSHRIGLTDFTNCILEKSVGYVQVKNYIF